MSTRVGPPSACLFFVTTRVLSVENLHNNAPNAHTLHLKSGLQRGLTGSLNCPCPRRGIIKTRLSSKSPNLVLVQLFFSTPFNSIHPSLSAAYLSLGHRGSRLSSDTLTSPAISSSLSERTRWEFDLPKPAEMHSLSSVPWVCPVAPSC